jgi:hypothetical protein
VRIEPHLGRLTKVSAQMPHPAGSISADYEKTGDDRWSIRIRLPAKVNGTFLWKGKSYPLHGQENMYIFH